MDCPEHVGGVIHLQPASEYATARSGRLPQFGSSRASTGTRPSPFEGGSGLREKRRPGLLVVSEGQEQKGVVLRSKKQKPRSLSAYTRRSSTNTVCLTNVPKAAAFTPVPPECVASVHQTAANEASPCCERLRAVHYVAHSGPRCSEILVMALLTKTTGLPGSTPEGQRS